MQELNIADDLKFMRSMMEKTHREIDPGAGTMITWGVINMILYPAVQILVTMRLYKWIYIVAYGLVAAGLVLTFWLGFRLANHQKMQGYVSHIGKQIGWVWGILVANGMFWSSLAIYKHWHPYFPGFIWAAVYATALSATGIIYSKEWLFGGIAIYITMAVGVFVIPYSYYLLGPVIGLACIIPSIIALNRLRRWERENGQRAAE